MGSGTDWMYAPPKLAEGVDPKYADCECWHCKNATPKGHIHMHDVFPGNYKPPPVCSCAGGGFFDEIGVEYDANGHPVEPAKHDSGKPRYDLIPPEGIEALAQVLTYGAGKYGPRNWESGMSWGKYFAACMRHLWAWWHGSGVDKESGLSHLAHAACCLMFLIAYEARGVGEDDRHAP